MIRELRLLIPVTVALVSEAAAAQPLVREVCSPLTFSPSLYVAESTDTALQEQPALSARADGRSAT
ncbi:MAG TPA: hypothetical protein VKK81_03830 [Candidatus Binatia bacterium]|nr:hypothetical protein [Candidatus Binatia bacterium]